MAVPAALEDVVNNPDFTDVIAYFVIPVEDKPFKTVRVNITLPEKGAALLRRPTIRFEVVHVTPYLPDNAT
jgi:hypothetical protein